MSELTHVPRRLRFLCVYDKDFKNSPKALRTQNIYCKTFFSYASSSTLYPHQRVSKLDSIAVSVFVVILVEFDKYRI